MWERTVGELLVVLERLGEAGLALSERVVRVVLLGLQLLVVLPTRR